MLFSFLTNSKRRCKILHNHKNENKKNNSKIKIKNAQKILVKVKVVPCTRGLLFIRINRSMLISVTHILVLG